MRYLMRQQVFCLGDDYTITDEQGRECFIVDGKAFSLSKRTSFRDMAGNELCEIRYRLASFKPTVEIDRGGRITTMSPHLFTFFKTRFTIDVPGPNDLEVTGDLLGQEYTFADEAGNTVATVSKKWFTLGDTYGVDIADGQDDVLILAATVVIDLSCHPDSHG